MNPEEQAALDNEAYAAAFEEDMMPASEPDDFEIPGKPAEEGEPEGEAVVAIVMEADDDVTEDMVEPAEDAPADAPAADAEEEEDPADLQRKKSWEGRLKAREAELKAREEALKAREEAAKQVVSESEEDDEPQTPKAQAAEEVAEQIEDGFEDDEAVRALAEDFGEDFVKTLGKLIERKAAQIAGRAVEERVVKVSQSVDHLVQGIRDDKQRAHFEAIQEAHPDFDEIASGSDLKAYVAALPDDQKAKAESVIQGGTSRQVIKLLNDFKKAREATGAQVDEDVVAAAEGVRSRGGMKLPSKPAASNDYASAWEDF